MTNQLAHEKPAGTVPDALPRVLPPAVAAGFNRAYMSGARSSAQFRQLVNDFVNETRRNGRDGVECGAMAWTGDDRDLQA
jgi:hypothetical protein